MVATSDIKGFCGIISLFPTTKHPFSVALTEDKPVIKTYFEDRWAELFDSKTAPIQLSLDTLKALHAKWGYFMKGLTEEDLSKSFIHPDGNEEVGLKENIGIYAWHCNHHYAHIEQLLIRKNWLQINNV